MQHERAGESYRNCGHVHANAHAETAAACPKTKSGTLFDLFVRTENNASRVLRMPHVNKTTMCSHQLLA
eukprot:2043531-Prymnesium_polylepis.1